jgi:hypothetical protein
MKSAEEDRNPAIRTTFPTLGKDTERPGRDRDARAEGPAPLALQTVGWFAVTIVGVAVVSGDIARWSLVNKVIAVVVVVGVGWLLVNASTA